MAAKTPPMTTDVDQDFVPGLVPRKRRADDPVDPFRVFRRMPASSPGKAGLAAQQQRSTSAPNPFATASHALLDCVCRRILNDQGGAGQGQQSHRQRSDADEDGNAQTVFSIVIIVAVAKAKRVIDDFARPEVALPRVEQRRVPGRWRRCLDDRGCASRRPSGEKNRIDAGMEEQPSSGDQKNLKPIFSVSVFRSASFLNVAKVQAGARSSASSRCLRNASVV